MVSFALQKAKTNQKGRSRKCSASKRNTVSKSNLRKGQTEGRSLLSIVVHIAIRCLGEHLRRMTLARPLLDPFAQGRILSAPCTLAPLQSVSQYQGWRCRQLCRSCLAGVRPDHRRSCDRQFLPMPFRQLGALSQSGALSRSLTTGLVWQSSAMWKSTAILTSQAPCCDP